MRLTIKWLNGWAYAHGTAPDGQRIRRALGTQDAGKAEEARSHLEARLWRKAHYGPEAVVTFDEAAVAYANDGGEVRFLVPISTQLQGKVLREITPKMIRDAARRAYPNAKNSTLNRQGITPARAVLNYAHSQGWCAPVKVDGFPVEKTRKQAVEQGYLDALRPHLPTKIYALLMFLHYTGRRVGEAIEMEWANVDGPRVFIPDTKNNEPAVAIMPKAVADLVHALPKDGDRVFGYAGRSSLYAPIRRAAKKAGVPYLGTHQPGRHSFATSLDRAGWTSKQIADAGGWKSAALVQNTYIHTGEIQARAASVLGKKMAKGYTKSTAKPRNAKEI